MAFAERVWRGLVREQIAEVFGGRRDLVALLVETVQAHLPASSQGPSVGCRARRAPLLAVVGWADAGVATACLLQVAAVTAARQTVPAALNMHALLQQASALEHCLSRLSKHTFPQQVDAPPSAAVHVVPDCSPWSEGQTLELPLHVSCESQL